ncbi:hypothetical protein HELRODRAFT_162977 [Helobdella robusta]|uniref:Uncharacterized protein n=1 Tax=Helobdella robusta TaxID=6412 RepID=T1ETH1_HELRO|nr:hypothetical protein HELRODRAFT_162977 [Helobdella robusta]ESN99429.1 hypothetical protein HELRODRAFT_162977 [Helobdella robusta]
MDKAKVVAEELKSTKVEERKKFIIKGVVDPRTNDHVAFKYAVSEGIINHRKGLYVNPSTNESLPIQRAMLEGKILVEYISVCRSLPETTAVPLITIKRRVDHKYIIVGALDPVTAEKLNLQEAIRRNIIDIQTGEYINESKGGIRINEEDAVEDGWIMAQFDETAPQFEIESFSVVGVLDHKFGMFVSFMQAVRRGLVDGESGDYISNLTGKKVYAVDAIRRGLIKAVKCSKEIKED